MPLLVLDPGHGGRDPGAVGRHVREKDINLQVCLLLRDELTRCGVRVVLTRDKDIERVPGVTEAIDLKARAMLANTHSADLFVSWHYDAASDPRVQGVAVWIHPSQRDKAAYHKAGLLAHEIAARTDQKNRGVYFGDFQVLRDTMMDALLIEGGFLTHPEEEALMTQPTFLQKQAEGAARALCRILDVPYIEAKTKRPSTPAQDSASTVVSPLRSQATTQAKALDSHDSYETVQIKLDGIPQTYEGRLIGGHTYIPVRDLAETLGLHVDWNGSTRTVSVTRGA